MYKKKILVVLLLMIAVIVLVVNVFRFNAAAQTWKPMGGGKYSLQEKPIGASVGYPSAAIASDGSIYLAYVNSPYDDVDLSIHIVQYDEERNIWKPVGDSIISSTLSDPKMVVVNNVPYVAYKDYTDGLIVKRYNRSSNKWGTVGQEGIIDREYGISFASNGKDTLYLAYYDEALKLSLKFFDLKKENSKWRDVGELPFSRDGIKIKAKELSLAVDNNVPYIAYYDVLIQNIRIQKFNDQEWIDIGMNGLFTDNVSMHNPHIGFDRHRLYLSYAMNDNSYPYDKGIIRVLEDGNKNWRELSSHPIFIGEWSVVYSNRIVMVTYSDKDSSIIVKQLNGNNWEVIGDRVVTGLSYTPQVVLIANQGTKQLYVFYKSLVGDIYAKRLTL